MTSDITKINHSCLANSAVYIQTKYTKGNVNINFMEIYAIRPIKKGEQITINYGPETAHKRDFECTCGKELEERKHIFYVSVSVASSLSSMNHGRVNEYIINYLDSK